jgi:hypothetical protein
MSTITLFDGLLMNLKGEIAERRREYLPKKEAIAQLKHHTGQDFGDDVEKWTEWIKSHPHSIRRSSVNVSERANKFLKGIVVVPENTSPTKLTDVDNDSRRKEPG